MKNLELLKRKVIKYYDQEAKDYVAMYDKGYKGYPANQIRLNFIAKRLKKNRIKKVLDAGCGSCSTIIKLLKEGFQVKGFDISKEMVKEGKEYIQRRGYDPALIFKADLENKKSLPKERFDAVVALGVFPHVLNEGKALRNMRDLLKPKGRVFIEFRNDLFAAYTLNKYSLDFFLNRALDLNSLPKTVSGEVVNFYSERFNLDKPNKRGNGRLIYTDIMAKFKNPLSIERELFKKNGFSVMKIHFYHYHALPPIFQNRYPKLFRKLSLKMEKPDDWRGYLMASAYVVEAVKN